MHMLPHVFLFFLDHGKQRRDMSYSCRVPKPFPKLSSPWRSVDENRLITLLLPLPQWYVAGVQNPEDSLARLAYCTEFYPSNFCSPGSFNFISLPSPPQTTKRRQYEQRMRPPLAKVLLIWLFEQCINVNLLEVWRFEQCIRPLVCLSFDDSNSVWYL